MRQALGERVTDGGAVSKRANTDRFDGATVLAGLRKLPGGRELLEEAAARDDVELVGGAVRDLLLGRTPRELDVVVGSGDASFDEAFSDAAFIEAASLFVTELAARLRILAEPNTHERFGTAFVASEGAQIDVATRRAESYPAPGALPEVRAGTSEEDLQRRDFTINAIAVSLGDEHRGELRAVPKGLEDLAEG